MPMMPLFHLQSPVPQLRDESRSTDQMSPDDPGLYEDDGPRGETRGREME